MNKDTKDIWSGFFIGSGSLIVVGLLIFVEALTMSLIVYYGLNHVLNRVSNFQCERQINK